MYSQPSYNFSEENAVPEITSLIAELKPPVTLELIRSLFELLHENKINYCHWKSSQHLDASMIAQTDLDVLFDLQQKEKIETLLARINFKKFTPPKVRQYNNIEDFIGFDYRSGKIVHLHAHFRLTIGEIYLKSFQLNLEDKILESRIYDEGYGIYRIHPAFELILLFFRQALKIRNRDKIKFYLRKNIGFAPNIMNEYEWLKSRCDENEIQTILTSIFDDNYRSVHELVIGKFNGIKLIKLADLLKNKYKDQRLHSPFGALMIRWYRELYLKGFQRYSKIVNKPIVLQRINPRGGLSIAIIGADGSGKSTVVNDLYRTYKNKLDVYKIYFGNGAGKISWYRKMLVGVKKNVVDYKKTLKINYSNPSYYKCLEALFVAIEKSANLKRMQNAKRKGMLVLCDRFPQNQVMGLNDGPVLHLQLRSKNPVLRLMAKLETNLYKRFDQTAPDIIIKLIANADILEARKPGKTKLEVLKKKTEGVRQLTFPLMSDVLTLDAEEPIDKVLFKIKKKIWETYN